MKNKSCFLFLRTLIFSVFIAVFTFIISTSVFAASAKLSSSAVTAQKGDHLSSNTLNITLGKKEIYILTDTITVTLDGASWEGYSDEGELGTNITYKKASEYQLEIHINPTESMYGKDLTISVPLNCVVLYDQAEISAIISYNLDGYTDGRYVFARCSYSRATLSGKIIERKLNEEIYSSTGIKNYNNLSIYVVGNDVARTKNSITVTLEGMTWSRLGDSGSVQNNANVSTLYKKTDKNTISLQLTNYTAHMTYSGYYITIPLTGTVTGTGELKACVDFGVDGTVPSEVVFGYCSDGDITVTSSSPDIAVNNVGRVSNITINDTTEQSFYKYTQFTLTLQQTYSFYQAPKINGTGKYADKCYVEISSDNQRQIVITLTDYVSAETGTIELTDIIVEKSASTTPKSENLTITFKGTGWTDYESTVSIGKYSAAAEYNPPLRMSTDNMYAAAKDYVITGAITFTDKGTDRNYSAGDKIVMTFDNDFYWFTEGTAPVLTATGKFEGACEFQFNTENKKEAYIVFKNDITSQAEGTIVLNSVSAMRNSDGYFSSLNMTAYIYGAPTTSSTLRVGWYYAAQTGKLTAAAAETQTEYETSSEQTSGSGTTVVKLAAGSKRYYIDEQEYLLSAAPYMKGNSFMLPIRVFANIVGISDENIVYSDGRVAFMSGGTEILVICAGEDTYTYKGYEKMLSTPAELADGTMFMSVRDLIKIAGISDENLSFDSETKILTIYITE